MSSLRLASRLFWRAACVSAARSAAPRALAVPVSTRLWRPYSSQNTETDKEFDDRWEAYFNRDDIDTWELRKGLNDLYGHDLVPEPRIIKAMLKAARRLDDLPMAVRVLEAVKQKAAGDAKIYSYIMGEIKSTLDDLGLKTPEELGLS